MTYPTFPAVPMEPGPRLIDGDQFNALAGMFQSAQGAITAFAGGGKASATQLNNGLNVIGTVGTAADSVLLPTAYVGAWLAIRNSGANAAQVFGKGTDTINGVATGTGVSQANATTALYICITAGAWFRILSA